MWSKLLLTTVSLIWIASANEDKKYSDFNSIVKKYQTLRVTPSILEESKKHISALVSFRAHDKEFQLHLKTNPSLFMPDFHLRLHEDKGRVSMRYVDTRKYVTGYLEDEKSVVHGKVSSEQFEGVIHTVGESYHIERIEKHLPPFDDHNVIVYKASDVDHNQTSIMSCGVRHSINRLQEYGGHFDNCEKSGNCLRKRMEVDNDFDTCAIHVWADYEFFSNVGDSDEAQTLDEMAFHISESDAIYRSTVFLDGSTELTGYGVAISTADIIKINNPSNNPLYGTFTVEELLESFAAFNFDDVCLGHLFTYREFRGTVGLAYLSDPSGNFAGGICQKRTQTFNGELNLNTGLTTLLNFGRKLPQAVSTITTAHEIGHNFGSEHDPYSGECAPGGSSGNYIMYPTATDGNLKNNQLFSSCSKGQMGQAIGRKGSCFIPKPSQQECGNGIVEGDEECDCKYNETMLCESIDPCCRPGECKLWDWAECSPNKYRCCQSCNISANGTICGTGDECLGIARCNGTDPSCPSPERENGTKCNDGNNVCNNGVCSGSVCTLYGAETCFCTEESQQCHVCCMFDGICQSTFAREEVDNATIQSGFPCKDFTGYCDKSGVCIFVDTDKTLNDLKNILPSFKSIVKWLRNNWYWVLVGIAITIILIILLQITYRQKSIKKNKRTGVNEERQALTRTNEEATGL